MKKIYIYILTLTTLIGLIACKQSLSDKNKKTSDSLTQESQNENKPEKKILYYTCPMHPQIHEPHPGTCPICGMTLVPVFDHSESTDTPNKNITISTSAQTQSGIITETTQQTEATKIIRASARIAFDPELAVAIREYQEVSKSAPNLKDAAIIKLKHMGFTSEDIKDIPLDRDVSSMYHLADANSVLYIYATLFENDAALISGGEEVIIEVPQHGDLMGQVKSIAPVVDAATRTLRVRIEVPPQENAAYLKPDYFVTAKIKINLGQKITVPKSAVVDTGSRQLVYVKQANNKFEPRDIQLGAELDNSWVVSKGLEVGEQIVTEATFFVDSESQLRGN